MPSSIILVAGDRQDNLKTQFIHSFASVANNGTCTYSIKETSQTYSVGLRDSTGMEEATPINALNYYGVNGVIFIFNYDNESSFTSIQNHWLNEAKTNAQNCPVLIVGVESNQMKVNKEKVLKFATEHQCQYAGFSDKNKNEVHAQLSFFARNKKFLPLEQSGKKNQRDSSRLMA